MSEFMIGCNYWGSKSGTEMWRDWDGASVARDLRELAQYGVRYMRVFPNWRDFQPVHAIRGWGGDLHEYRLHGTELLTDPAGLDEACMDHFAELCRAARENHIQLIVALVTGWMSGRMFAPPAVDGLNHITDPESLKWQTRFVRGFVRRFRDEPAICAWDLGNESNNLSRSPSRAASYAWTALISSTIRSEDATRPVMSGMHALSVNLSTTWTIQDQGELTDMLTPHPYLSPTVGGEVMPLTEIPTTMIPTFQCAFYSGIGGKPAMLQEIGTFNDQFGNKELVAQNMRVNIWSAWANGARGYLWWCAHEQLPLNFPPYSWSAVERELGLLNVDYSPKPAARMMRQLTADLDALNAKLPGGTLPPKRVDAVYVATRQEVPFHEATSAYALAKQAGFELSFVYFDQKLPDAQLYLAPSLVGWAPMDMEMYNALLEKARGGATVYFSASTGVISEFESVTGLISDGQKRDTSMHTADFCGTTLPFSYTHQFLLRSQGAEVLAQDESGCVVFSRYRYGKGTVYYLNFPLETMLWEHRDWISDLATPYYRIYEELSRAVRADSPAAAKSPDIGLTVHPIDETRAVAVAVNYTGRPVENPVTWKADVSVTPIKGDANRIDGCDCAVYMVERK